MLNVPQHRHGITGSRPLHHNPKYFLLLITFGCALLVADYSITKQFAPSLFEAVAPALARRSGGLDEKESSETAGSLFDPVEVPLLCPRNNSTRRRVIDIIWVNTELPSLELRLNELWNVVDVFFINESTISWKAIPFKNQTLKPKPLYVTEHLKTDFHKFQSKIVVHVIPPEISHNTNNTGSYAIEMAQRGEVWGGLQRLLQPHPEDLLIWNDLDEIPRPHMIEKFACDPPGQLPPTPICLHTQQGFYYYNYLCRQTTEWTIRPRLSLFKDGKPGNCRTKIPDGATHCSSCFGSIDYLRNKIMSNADPMEDTPEQLNNKSIIERVRQCKDVYLRHNLNNKLKLLDNVDESKMPIIVTKHPERWPYLFAKGPLYEDEPAADTTLALPAPNVQEKVKQHGHAQDRWRWWSQTPKSISLTHPAKLADGCYHIFLDVGANIGVHSRFLFEPDKYPDAERAHGVFDSEFGDANARDNRDMCAFAFEPNPKHASRHQALEEAYKQQGWRYHYIAAAVSNAEGNITFYHNHDEYAEEWGFSDHDLKTGGKAGSPISIPALRLSDWLMKEVHERQLPTDVQGSYKNGPRVVMKMDIESQEYAVLPDLMFSGSLCKTVNTIFGEYHPWAIKYDQDQSTGRGGLTIAEGEGPKKIADFVAFFHSFRYCEMNTRFIELDDESYLHDGVPLPS